MKPKEKKVSARGGGGAVTRGFSPSPSSSSESSEECSDSTISSTATPVVLAKKIKKMVMKMDRKADMLQQIKQELKYLEVLVKEHTGGSYAEKYKDLLVLRSSSSPQPPALMPPKLRTRDRMPVGLRTK